MKRILSVVLLTVLALCPLCISAENGEVVGKIYSTDILAYVNDKPIDAYNIGGRTVVMAEDLESYGFYVLYDDTTRHLKIASHFHDGLSDFAEIPRGKTGKILGDIFKTDIRVTYNDIEITGYNIGGRTAVCIEDLGNTENSPHSSYGYSKYLAKYVWNPDEKTISLYSYQKTEPSLDISPYLSRVLFTFSDNVLYAKPSDDLARSDIFPSVEGVLTNDENARTYYFSEEFGEKKYILSPLYLDALGEKYEIGTCVTLKAEDGTDGQTVMSFNNKEEVLSLASKVKNPILSYDEALKLLTASHPVIKRLDNDDYTVIYINADNHAKLYAVKKSGGYLHFEFFGYDLENVKTRTLDFKENTNTLVYTEYPFGGPHGPVTMTSHINLDEYKFE